MNILILGGGRGLGRAIGEHLAGRGHALGLVARTVHQIDEAAGACRDLGARAWPVAADVLDRVALKAAIVRIAEAAGGLDALIYAAGQFRAVGPLVAVDPDAWWRDAETTLRGFALAVREAIPFLKRSGNPSISTLIGPGHADELAFGSGYGSAQAGLARLVESLAVELEPERIPVYAVNPGLVPTPMLGHILDSPEGRRWLSRFTEAFAEGKEVGPGVAAEMVAWLVEERPASLSARIVSALLPPEVLSIRLDRIEAEDLGKLRLR
jgi:NAD(P)-dependent dehydrogenase (short-subunit alcohol dehydrogenase family)